MYIVIAGGGKIGEYLAATLLSNDNYVAIIDEDEKTAQRLSMTLEGRYLVICGDGCNSRFQEDAGIRKADVFVATTGQDDDNLVACQIAQRVFDVPRCIARVNSPKNLRIFKELGIESVSSTTLIAKLIEEEAMLGSISVVSSMTHGNVALAELTVPKFKHPDLRAQEEGVLVRDIEMPENSIIVAISTADDVVVVGSNTRMKPGDSAIVAYDGDTIDEVRSLFKIL